MTRDGSSGVATPHNALRSCRQHDRGAASKIESEKNGIIKGA